MHAMSETTFSFDLWSHYEFKWLQSELKTNIHDMYDKKTQNKTFSAKTKENLFTAQQVAK